MKYILRIAFAVALFVSSSHADVIYNTFGPDYGVGDAAIVIAQQPHYESVAAPFTPSVPVNLSQMDFGFFSYGGTNNIEIDLTNDNGGLPGSIIQSWKLQLSGFQQYISTVTTNASLAGNTQYWIAVSALDKQTDVGWIDSYGELQGPEAIDNGTGWYLFSDGTIPAFDVIGTPVPEPGTLLLLGTAGFGIAGFLRRKLG